MVNIKISEAGEIRLDDEQLSLGDLESSLRTMGSESHTLEIQVDKRCLAEHLLGVVRICKEAGLENVRFTSLDDSADEG